MSQRRRKKTLHRIKKNKHRDPGTRLKQKKTLHRDPGTRLKQKKTLRRDPGTRLRQKKTLHWIFLLLESIPLMRFKKGLLKKRRRDQVRNSFLYIWKSILSL